MINYKYKLIVMLSDKKINNDIPFKDIIFVLYNKMYSLYML